MVQLAVADTRTRKKVEIHRKVKSKALVPYRRHDEEELVPYRKRDEEALVPVLAGELPKGNGDVGDAVLRILACVRQADVNSSAPESTVVAELQTQTEVAAGEMLETQKRGRVVHRARKWYFEQEREGE